MKTDLGAYIHIPFCNSKCAYCNFFSQVRSKDVRREYVKALASQIRSYPNKAALSTVYIGGGTPSVLSAEDFREILSALHEVFDLSSVSEFTVEMNPESVNDEILSVLKDGKADRISLGIQSFCDDELCFCNRKHSAKEAENAFLKIRSAGFENISVDIMLALPGQTEKKLLYSLEKTVSLSPDHVSAYILKVEEKTLFSARNVKEADENTAGKLYLLASDFLQKHGFEHYEISNFAKPEKRGKHNFSYWQGKNYVAFGAGAYGYENRVRYHYAPDISSFIVENGLCEKIADETLFESDINEEKLMLGLRTSDGVSVSDFNSEMCDFASRLEKSGLGKTDGGRFFLTPRGFLVSNGIIAEFLALFEK